MSFVKTCGKLVRAGLVTLALSVPAFAEKVTTKYFTLDLPEGWTQPQPAQEGDGTLMAIFQSKKDGSAVTVTVLTNPMPAKDVAAQTVANMKQGGVNASDPVEKDGAYMSTFSQGQGKGVSYFASNGKEFSVTTVLGPNTDTGAELLKKFKPADAKLFPKF